jgi:hypothetical protein
MRLLHALIPAIAVAMTIVGSASAEDTPSLPTLPKCISMTTEARSRNGSNGSYDHVVHLTNQCGADASCTVSTNVQPEPIWADVANKKHVEVVMLEGSREAVFRPTAFCVVDDP